jgi:hypothetical protein
MDECLVVSFCALVLRRLSAVTGPPLPAGDLAGGNILLTADDSQPHGFSCKVRNRQPAGAALQTVKMPSRGCPACAGRTTGRVALWVALVFALQAGFTHTCRLLTLGCHGA